MQDRLLNFTTPDGQALSGASDVYSTDAIDLAPLGYPASASANATRDIALGTTVYVYLTVLSATATNDVIVYLREDTAADMSASPADVGGALVTFSAGAAAGTTSITPIPVSSLNDRYLKLFFDKQTGAVTGTIYGCLCLHPPVYKQYAFASTVKFS